MNKTNLKKIANRILRREDNSSMVEQLKKTIFKDKAARNYLIEIVLSNPELFHQVSEYVQSSPSFNDRLREIPIKDTHVGLDNKTTREEWLEKTLKKIDSGKRILDAGAGELQYKKFCSHLEYVSQDFAQFDPSKLNEGNQPDSWDNSKLDIVSDIVDIPVDNESFDAIMCIEVFEHLPQPALAVKEFSRIVRKGGQLIITAPFASLTHFAPYFFANGYSKYWYEHILQESGFEIEELLPNGNYFDYLAQELRRIDSVASKYANDSLTLKEGLMVKELLVTMERMSLKGNTSSELLCFGYHVLARKL